MKAEAWREQSTQLAAWGNPAVADVKDFTRAADIRKRRGVGAGHPHLRTPQCQLAEQRDAAIGIEMRHHRFAATPAGDRISRQDRLDHSAAIEALLMAKGAARCCTPNIGIARAINGPLKIPEPTPSKGRSGAGAN